MTVYTYGVFDLFHYGHIIAIKEAKKLGDKLIVGIFTDKIAESFKRKPVINENERFKLIQELGFEAILLNDLKPRQEYLDKLGVNIVAKAEGAGWENEIPQWDGIKSVLLPYTKGISTSEIIKRCRQ